MSKSDPRLIRGILRKNPENWNSYVHEVHQELRLTARDVLSTSPSVDHDVHDVVQAALLRAWTNLGQFRAADYEDRDLPVRFYAWLKTIVTNVAMDTACSKNGRGRAVPYAVAEQLEMKPSVSEATEAFDKLWTDSRTDEIDAQILRLLIAGVSQRRIKTKLGLTRTSFESRLRRYREFFVAAQERRSSKQGLRGQVQA